MTIKSCSPKNIHYLYKENRMDVMEILRKFGPISKPDIAKLTGLTSVSVTNIIKDLSKVGFIKEQGLEKSKGGRRALLYSINGNGKCAICVDLTGKNIVIAAVDPAGKVIKTSEFPAKSKENDFIHKLIHSIDYFIKTSIPDRTRILGIGVTTPGLIDHEKGVVKVSLPLGWKNVPLKTVLSQAFNYPIFVTKDNEAAILGEYYFGDHPDYKNPIYLVYGIGIGIGIMIKNKIHWGSRGVAGELGHTIVDPDGPLCNCGNRGCLEHLASVRALIGYVEEMIAQGRDSLLANNNKGQKGEIEVSRIFQAFHQGDQVALEAVKKTARYLAVGLVNLFRILDPDVIILGGNIEDNGRPLFNELKNIIKEYHPLIDEKMALEYSKVGEFAGIYGVSIQVFNSALEQDIAKMSGKKKPNTNSENRSDVSCWKN